MKFYKDCESFSFWLSTFFVFAIEILYIYFINDDSSKEKNQVLIIHKLIFYFLFFLKFCSHFATSFVDPGIIEKSNNKEMLEFYNSLYKEILKAKEKYGRFNLVTKENESSDEEDEISEEDNNTSTMSNDTSRIQIINNNTSTSIFQKKKKIISKKYGFELTKCNSCQVSRPKGTHHCSDCHHCILERNNHCPWMNNCIGIFNRKYYLLFCLYCTISVAYSSCIYFYYVVFKNFRTFRNSISRSLLGIFFMFFCFIYGGFCYMMLKDERNQVIKEFEGYGNEQKKLMKLKMRIIFGGNFSPLWFFPCFKGGKTNYNSIIGQKKKESTNKRKKISRKGLFK